MVTPANEHSNSLESVVWEKETSITLTSQTLDKVQEALQNLPERYKKVHQWKVRDTYDHPDYPNQLIIIATDRVSTHDVVHKNTVPGKWEILTQISNFWFQYFSEHPDTKHIKTQKVKDFEFPQGFPDYLKKRAIIVQKLNPLPTEAIVRWYHYGSAAKWYDSETGKLSTWIFVGTGLEKCSQYEKPIFTPSTKGKVDININFEQMIQHIDDWIQENDMENKIGKKLDAGKIAHTIREYSLTLYRVANEYAKSKWITLGDTKFEFALNQHGEVVLIDEACTPDSSRFWTSFSVIVWEEPESHDKQPLREEAIRLWEDMGDTEKKTPLTFSKWAIEETVNRYQAMREVFDLRELAVEFYDEMGRYFYKPNGEGDIFIHTNSQTEQIEIEFGASEWEEIKSSIKRIIFRDGTQLFV